MKLFTLFTLLLSVFCLLPLVAQSSDTVEQKTIYVNEVSLQPEFKKNESDTIYDSFLVFERKDLEDFKDILLVGESDERLFTVSELLSGKEEYGTNKNKVYIKLGKADYFRGYEILGTKNDGLIVKIKKLKTNSSSPTIQQEERLIKKYDIKVKK